MLRGIYTAAAGALSNMIATDTLANNLANVNTVGFKKNNINFQAFPDMLIQRIDNNGSPVIGAINNGAKVRSTAIHFAQGDLVQTGAPLDLAIQGDGFFTVKNAKGDTFYTRAGNFTISPDGYMVAQTGERVQGERGDILIPNGKQLMINPQGEISELEGNIDQIKITRFENNHMLEKVGDTFYQATPGAKIITPDPAEAPVYKVHQGMVEHSNVNAISEMVNTIVGLRLYESLQKNIQTQNHMLEKAVNQVGQYKV